MMMTGFFILFALSSCENDARKIVQYDLPEKLPMQSIKDAEFLYSNEGNVVMKLKAPLVDQYQGDKVYSEMPKGVHLQIYDSALRVTSELTSNYAIDLEYENRMEAREDVVVINEKGEQLNTEHLVWDKKSAKFTSDVFVKITTKNQVLMGEGLIANQDFSDYQILKPRGTINIDDE